MQKLITNNVNILPSIEIIDGNDVRVRWDFKEILNDPQEDVDENVVVQTRYSYIEEVFKIVPTLKEIKDTVEGYHNNLCNEEILSGLKYKGYTVWLTTENQFNYKGAFDFCFQEFVLGNPYETPEFKMDDNGIPVYVTFETLGELGDFVRLCRDHIQNTLKKYWIIKDAIDWTQYELN